MSPGRIVISKNGLSDAKRHDFEEALAERCAAEGLRTLIAPDIYHLASDANAVLALRAIEGPIILFSWHWPRAAFWTLHQLGVKGAREESLEKESFPEDKRPILCLNMADRCCPGRWIERIGEVLGGRFPGGKAEIDRIGDDTKERWYPVIDYSRCTNCQECLEFCLFGVYGKDEEGRIVAAAPDACKPGCPACSRVCPNQAIMFPLHESDEVIAGSDHGTIQPFDPGLPSAEDLKKQYEEGKVTLQDVLRACGCKTKSVPPDRKASAASCCPEGTCDKPGAKNGDRGYFDRLIDGLIKD